MDEEQLHKEVEYSESVLLLCLFVAGIWLKTKRGASTAACNTVHLPEYVESMSGTPTCAVGTVILGYPATAASVEDPPVR